MIALNNRLFTSEKTTLGAIYIVRDPRNILSSLKNHYDFKDYNEAFEFMKIKKNISGISEKIMIIVDFNFLDLGKNITSHGLKIENLKLF